MAKSRPLPQEAVNQILREEQARAEKERRESKQPQPILTPLSSVKAEKVSWLWFNRIARGKINLFVGDPGLGKSQMTLDIASRCSIGASWPNGFGNAPIGKTILLSCEDGLADTVRPRVDKYGGDPERIMVLEGVRLRNGKEKFFSLIKDLDMLERAIQLAGDVVLIIIDPLTAYLGKKVETDSHRDTDVRAVLEPVASLAEKYKIAVIAVMHLNKAAQSAILYRIGGSIGFVGISRTISAVLPDPEDEDRRLLAQLKNNVGPKEKKCLSFKFSKSGVIEWGRAQWMSVRKVYWGSHRHLRNGPNARTRMVSFRIY
jgi:putative DNA primase/helicase